MGDYSKPTYANVKAQVVSYNGKPFVNQFIDNDGEYASLNNLYLDQIKETKFCPTRTGYTFAGYKSTADGTPLKINRDGSVDSSDIVNEAKYEALWLDKENPTLDSVTFTDNLSDKQTVTISGSDTGSGVDSYYVGKKVPTKETVVFENKTNWTVNSDGIWYVAIRDKEGNITCNKYTFHYVVFDGNKGLSANTPSVTCEKKLVCGNTVGKLPSATKTGYTFLGWAKITLPNDCVLGKLFNEFDIDTTSMAVNFSSGAIGVDKWLKLQDAYDKQLSDAEKSDYYFNALDIQMNMRYPTQNYGSSSIIKINESENIAGNVSYVAVWQIQYSIVGDKIVAYDGKEHFLSVTTQDANVIPLYSKNKNQRPSATWTEPVKYTDAGNYESSFALVYKDDTYTQFVFEPLGITINKVSAVAVKAPTYVSTAYNGSAISLANAGSSNDGTIYYRLGTSGAFSTTIPSAKLPGTYTVYWYVKADKNHNDGPVNSFNSTINALSFANVKSTGYTGAADTKIHYGSVSTSTSGAKIEYSSDNKTWSTSNIGSSACGTKTVYYRITKEGYTTVTGNFKITLNHNYTAQSVTSTYLKSAATCTNKAVYYYKCCNCTAKGTTTYTSGNALGHSCSNYTTGYGNYSGSCGYSRCDRCHADCGGHWDSRIDWTGNYETTGKGYEHTSTVTHQGSTVTEIWYVNNEDKWFNLANTSSVYYHGTSPSHNYYSTMNASGIGSHTASIYHYQQENYFTGSIRVYFADGTCIVISIT